MLNKWRPVTDMDGNPNWVLVSETGNIIVEVVPVGYRIKAMCFDDNSQVTFDEVYRQLSDAIEKGSEVMKHSIDVFEGEG